MKPDPTQQIDPGPDRPGARTGSGWRKNRERKNSVWSGWPGDPVDQTRLLFYYNYYFYYHIIKKKLIKKKLIRPIRIYNLSCGFDKLTLIDSICHRFSIKNKLSSWNFLKPSHDFTGLSSVFLDSSSRPDYIKSTIKGFNLKLELEKDSCQKVLRITNRNEFKNTYKE